MLSHLLEESAIVGMVQLKSDSVLDRESYLIRYGLDSEFQS